MSARKLLLMQFYPLHHHGIRAEPSHRTFDFSNHDHHIKAFEDSHSSTQYFLALEERQYLSIMNRFGIEASPDTLRHHPDII